MESSLPAHQRTHESPAAAPSLVDPRPRARATYDPGQLTLKKFVQLLLHDKWLVLSMTIAFTVAAGLAAWLLPRWYDAKILVSPLGEESVGGGFGGLSSIASQFSGLASLAGVSTTGDTRKAESVAVLQSDAIAERYIRDNNLLPVLYASKWNAVRKTWNTSDPDDVPTLWKAAQYFRKRICDVDIDSKTGLVTLTVTWRDPAIAARWANGVVKMTNDYLRGKAIAESQRDIDYLTAQAAKTDAVGIKETIYALLESELDKAMMAQGTQEYAFKVLDPALAPEIPSFPRPLLWVALGLLCGATISAFVVLIRAHWREDA
ncbi:MAG: Wzz/FepE/Etk N-terminal domain-containing protein [Steroidobacteraceae bacterium]